MNKVLRLAALLVVSFVGAHALDRSAITFTRYDLRASIVPEQHSIDVNGVVTVRNDSAQPQSNIALQISSSLTWAQIAIGDENPSWLTHPYTSDIDHTGALTEAVITLDKPLQPKESLEIRVHYGGTISRDATRLTRIGTPNEVALRSDWDQIGSTFTAVRGIGYVTWYPISMDAASFAKGDEVFNAIAAWKEREGGTNLNVCFASQAAGAKPSDWTSNGLNRGYTSSAPEDYCRTFLTNTTASFVVGALQANDRANLTVYAAADHTSVARDYIIAAEKAETTLAQWFGAPRRKAVIVELADPDALPFEDGEYLFTPIKPAPPLALEVALARVMTHAHFDSPRPWIREGLAAFSQALVREQQQGRKAGLAYLNQFVNALAVAEDQARSNMQAGESSSKTALPAIGAQPLTQTHDEIFYRTKAAFVWWMLRDMVGDDALKTFLSRYNAEADKDPSYAQKLLENAGSTHRDLEAFFDSWVYADRGLPELSVTSAYGRKLLNSAEEKRVNNLVTISVENSSAVWVEVPVLVRAGSEERVMRLVVEPHSKAVARLNFPGAPEDAIVNDGSVPEADVSDNGRRIQVSAPE